MTGGHGGWSVRQRVTLHPNSENRDGCCPTFLFAFHSGTPAHGTAPLRLRVEAPPQAPSQSRPEGNSSVILNTDNNEI